MSKIMGSQADVRFFIQTIPLPLLKSIPVLIVCVPLFPSHKSVLNTGTVAVLEVVISEVTPSPRVRTSSIVIPPIVVPSDTFDTVVSVRVSWVAVDTRDTTFAIPPVAFVV